MNRRILMLNYLLYDVFPAAPHAEEFVQPCLEACDLYRDGDGNETVRLPEGMINGNNGSPYVMAREIVEHFGLDRTTFVQ